MKIGSGQCSDSRELIISFCCLSLMKWLSVAEILKEINSNGQLVDKACLAAPHPNLILKTVRSDGVSGARRDKHYVNERKPDRSLSDGTCQANALTTVLARSRSENRVRPML
eukprot:sb/3477060/